MTGSTRANACAHDVPQNGPHVSTLLQIRNLSIGFRLSSGGLLRVVDDVNLELPAGGSLGLVGESGSGKSTLASAIVGLTADAAVVEQGRILFDDCDLLGLSAQARRRLRGRRIAMIPQDAAASLNPVFTVGSQMQEVIAGNAAERRRSAVALLEEVRVAAPEQRLSAYPHMLSGGIKQRVLGAMALAGNADLVIADEPTTALDVTVQAAYLRLVSELRRRRGFALLLISHDLGVVRGMCEHVAVMKDGRIVEQGPTERIFEAPEHAYTKSLLRSRASVDARVHWLGGFEPETSATPATPAPAAAEVPLLEAQNVQRTFRVRHGLFGHRELHAVDGLSLRIGEGETLSLVGESGSGKTTTANIVLGLDQPSAGRILWRGVCLGDMTPAQRAAWRLETNAVFQDPMGSLDPRMRVGASIAEPLRQLPGLPAAERASRVAQALRAVSLLPEHAERYPHQFSGGQRQRIAIARALVTRPRLIVLDEPVASLDLTIQAQVMNLLKRLQVETGISYLMISHNLATVRFLSTRVAVMQGGRIVEQGLTEEVLGAPQHAYTRTLIAAARATEGGSLDDVPLDAGLA